MSVFIETQTDPFVGNMEELAADQRANRQIGEGVRRPVRGLEIKQDTYAVLRVMKSDGTFINVIDQAGGIIEGEGSVAKTANYTNFFIQRVVDERHEKQQILDTFGDAFIFFFGEAPRVTQVTGYLLNSNDFDWRNEFWANYEKYFRGTRLVEQNARLYLIYDDIIIEGYMLSASAQNDANQPHLIQFNFTMFITGYSTISHLGDPNYPRASNLDYSEQSTYGQLLKRAQENRATQKLTNTQITRMSLRAASAGAFTMGSIGGIADGIRNNMLNPDPSISGLVGGLPSAMSGLDGIAGSLLGSEAPTREIPLRSTFRDNTDEFIGGNDYLNARQRASALNLSEEWLSFDGAMDRLMENIVSNTASSGIFDVMGRGGRSIDAMSRRGAPSTHFGPNRSQLANSGTRKVPFGIEVEEEITPPDGGPDLLPGSSEE